MRWKWPHHRNVPISLRRTKYGLRVGAVAVATLFAIWSAVADNTCYKQVWDLASNIGCQPLPTVNPTCWAWSQCGQQWGYTNCPSGSGFHDPLLVRIGTYLVESGGQKTFTIGADYCYRWVPCQCNMFTQLCEPLWGQAHVCTTPTWQAQHAAGPGC